MLEKRPYFDNYVRFETRDKFLLEKVVKTHRKNLGTLYGFPATNLINFVDLYNIRRYEEARRPLILPTGSRAKRLAELTLGTEQEISY